MKKRIQGEEFRRLADMLSRRALKLEQKLFFDVRLTPHQIGWLKIKGVLARGQHFGELA
jgi:hypothetical protein